MARTEGERLAIVETIIKGNGRPSLPRLIDNVVEVLEGLDKRVHAIEIQNVSVKGRNSQIWANIRNIVLILAFIASIVFNCYHTIGG